MEILWSVVVYVTVNKMTLKGYCVDSKGDIGCKCNTDIIKM